MQFDIREIPFSRFGTYYSISIDKWDNPLGEGVYLRTHRGRGVGRQRELFRLDLLRDGAVVAASVDAAPARLILKGPRRGKVAFCFGDAETLRIRGEGVGLRLEMPTGSGVVAHPAPGGRWVANAAPSRTRHVVECLRGRLTADAPWGQTERARTRCERVVFELAPDGEGVFEAAVTECVNVWPARTYEPFERCLAGVERQWQAWLSRAPSAPAWLARGRRRAAYVNWSAVVRPCGLLTRPAMLMNKSHMDQVWSWDHCFNAMALSYHEPALAWDQLMLLADHQDAGGAMPDSISDAAGHFSFSKPPVHGWALDFMRRRNRRLLTGRRLLRAYEWLSRWSNWWLVHRVWPGDVLPHYLHGNDSGWDNSTLFDQGTPLVAPDLAACLAIQLEVVGDLADRLHRPRAAARWRRKAARLLDGLLGRLWRGDRFVGVRRPDGTVVDCDSLITCVPLLLGRRLPAAVRGALVRRVRRHLTKHGVATEQPASPAYNARGYWRGPVWAPPVMQIVWGLADAGETALTRTISRRFCRAAAKCSYNENFDALTGQGASDRAYTWTASVFLILAHEYV